MSQRQPSSDSHDHPWRGAALTIGLALMAYGLFSAWLPGVAQAENLIINPSFEERDSAGMPQHWTFWAKPQAVTLADHAFVGMASLRVQPPPGATYRVQQTVKLAHSGEHDLLFHTHVVGQAEVHASWTLLDDQGQRVSTPRYWSRRIRAAEAGSGWLAVHTPVQVPPQAVELQLTFWITLDKAAQQGQVHLDEVQLTSRQAEQVQSLALPQGARLVYETSFEGPDELAHWTAVSGQWQIDGQALHGRQRAILIYNQDVGSPNMRVEYTVHTTDQPADLSALLAVDQPAAWSKLQGYFFGFGSQLNTTHQIQRLPASGGAVLAKEGGALQTLATPIVAGRKHRVVVQRRHHELEMYVDDKPVLEAHDMLYAGLHGQRFGFYLWEGGVIDDVKVYALPWSASRSQAEVAVEHQQVDTWEDSALPPYLVEVGQAEVERINLPTWVYVQPMGNAMVDDHGLRIRTMADAPTTRLSRAFEPMASGIIELDFMARRHDSLRLAVRDTQGEELLHVVIDPSGQFALQQGDRLVPLREKVRYQRRVFDADFRLIPETWYTLRFQFMDGAAQIALLDQYAEIEGDFDLGRMGDHMPLHSDHTFSMQGRQAGSLAVTFQGENELLIDNVIAFGPVGTQSVRGQPLHQSAARLLDLDITPRKDPFLLKVQSYRHLTRENYRITPRLRLAEKAPHYGAFRKAGQIYNARLIDLAFMEERIHLLQRAAFYARHQPMHDALAANLSRLEALYARREHLQQDALRAYAQAYLDGQQPERLDAFFEIIGRIFHEQDALHALLDQSLAHIDALVDPQAMPRPVRMPPIAGSAQWNPASKRWEKNGQPVMVTYFSHAAGNPFYHDDFELLGMERPGDVGSGYQAFPFRDGQETMLAPGQYVNLDLPNWQWLDRLHAEDRKGLMRLAVGFNYAVTAAPDWWLKAHQDQDVIMVDRQGRRPDPTAWRGQQMLNWWHPAVRELIQRQFEAVSQAAADHAAAISLIHAGWELKNTFPQGVAPGRNASAVEAFQHDLARQYGDIAALNREWGTTYQNFQHITPAGMDASPSGLRQAYSRFVHDGFIGWLADITRAMHRHLPGVPVASDSQYTLGGRAQVEAIDPVGYFRAVDVKLYHTYQAWDRKLVDRWHGQLGAATGTAWGTMEWATSQGTGEMFRTDRIRNNGLREKAMQMIWGAALSEFYGFGFDNWQYAIGIHEPRLDRLTFNYTAPLYPLSMDRARRLGQAALTIPLVKPQVGLLETTRSYHQGLPVREGMQEAAIQLTDAGWNYEFLYEALLEEGVQRLEGIQALIVPYGLCMDDALHARLHRWVEQGGVLLAVGGPPGWMNAHGRHPADRPDLLAGAWQATADGWEHPSPASQVDDQGIRQWAAPLGKGRVIVMQAMSPMLMHTLAEHLQPRVSVSDADIQWCLRQQDDVLYLYALNWSVDSSVTADILVRDAVDSITDHGLERPMRVPFESQGRAAAFQTTLAPAAVTLFTLRLKEEEHRP